MARICGAGIGFLGFSLSLIIGLAVGNCFTTVVLRAVMVLFLGYMLGCALFWIGQKVIVENFENQLAEAQKQEQANEGQEGEGLEGAGSDLSDGSQSQGQAEVAQSQSQQRSQQVQSQSQPQSQPQPTAV
jgi:hypothetical protein